MQVVTMFAEFLHGGQITDHLPVQLITRKKIAKRNEQRSSNTIGIVNLTSGGRFNGCADDDVQVCT